MNIMRRRYLLLPIFLIVISGVFAACSSQLKGFQKDPSLMATWTPFQSMATYTSTSTPLSSVRDALASDLNATMTLEAAEGTESEATALGEEITPTPAGDGSLADPAGSPPAPTATWVPVNPTATYQPGPSNTPRPAIKTNTPKPPAATNTPKPPADTNTPQPAGDTNTPVPPADTNTPVPPTATDPPGACVFSGNSTYENQVITLINKERTDRGLPALTKNSSLTTAARLHSQDMACNDHWSHTGSNGSTLGSRLLAAGYSYSWAAENIATSSSQYFSPASVVNMWMNSSGHRTNILHPNMVHIGVGFRYADDVTIGDWGAYDAYYTADFGAP